VRGGEWEDKKVCVGVVVGEGEWVGANTPTHHGIEGRHRPQSIRVWLFGVKMRCVCR